jgi:hypothetical protein
LRPQEQGEIVNGKNRGTAIPEWDVVIGPMEEIELKSIDVER